MVWVGLMPHLTQVNDLVATFYDCDAVTVLRPLGGGHCKIIGTAMLVPFSEVVPPSIGPVSSRINQYNSGGEEVAFHVDIETLRVLAS
jgi:hypothetical protein